MREQFDREAIIRKFVKDPRSLVLDPETPAGQEFDGRYYVGDHACLDEEGFDHSSNAACAVTLWASYDDVDGWDVFWYLIVETADELVFASFCPACGAHLNDQLREIE